MFQSCWSLIKVKNVLSTRQKWFSLELCSVKLTWSKYFKFYIKIRIYTKQEAQQRCDIFRWRWIRNVSEKKLLKTSRKTSLSYGVTRLALSSVSKILTLTGNVITDLQEISFWKNHQIYNLIWALNEKISAVWLVFPKNDFYVSRRTISAQKLFKDLSKFTISSNFEQLF